MNLSQAVFVTLALLCVRPALGDPDATDAASDTGGGPPPAELIPLPLANASLEQGDPLDETLPLGWQPWVEGTPGHEFQYLPYGYEGDRAVRVDLWQPSGGRAMWISPAVTRLADHDAYVISDVFWSTTYTRLMVMLDEGQNASDWIEVATLPPADTWTAADYEVILAPGSGVLHVVHVIDLPGILVTDAYSVAAIVGTDPDIPSDPPGSIHPATDRPLVSLAFDDGWLSAYDIAVPLMEEYGYRGSHYIHSQFMDSPDALEYHVSAEQVLSLAQRGHEIGSHGLYHVDLTGLTPAELHAQVVDSKARLASLGIQISGFAPPGGAINDAVRQAILAEYDYIRTISEKLNYPPYNLQDVGVFIVSNETTVEQIDATLQDALETRGWLVLLLHRFETEAVADTIITPDMWESVLHLLDLYWADVRPVGEVLGTWSLQPVGPEPSPETAVPEPDPEPDSAESPEVVHWDVVEAARWDTDSAETQADSGHSDVAMVDLADAGGQLMDEQAPETLPTDSGDAHPGSDAGDSQGHLDVDDGETLDGLSDLNDARPSDSDGGATADTSAADGNLRDGVVPQVDSGDADSSAFDFGWRDSHDDAVPDAVECVGPADEDPAGDAAPQELPNTADSNPEISDLEDGNEVWPEAHESDAAETVTDGPLSPVARIRADGCQSTGATPGLAALGPALLLCLLLAIRLGWPGRRLLRHLGHDALVGHRVHVEIRVGQEVRKDDDESHRCGHHL